MARKKVKLAWIPNDSARRATFRKRRKGLMKKLEELSVLCNVEACGIVYGPDEPQPEVWPSKAGARCVLERFKSMPVMEQSKKMMDQEGFTRHQVMKLQDQLRKHERENQELEMAIVMHRCLCGDQQGLDYMNMEELTSLAMMVEAKLKSVHDRMELITVQMTSQQYNDASSHDQTEQYHMNHHVVKMDANTTGAIVVHHHHEEENNNNNNNNQWELAVAMDVAMQKQAWYTTTTTTTTTTDHHHHHHHHPHHVMNPIPINDPAVYYGSGEEVMQQPPYPNYMGMTNLNMMDPPCWL